MNIISIIHKIREDKNYISEIPKKLWDNKDFAYLIVSQNASYYINLSYELKHDRNFILTILQINPYCFEYIDADLKRDKEFLYLLLEDVAGCYCFLDEDIQSDKNFNILLVKANINCYLHMPIKLKEDRDICELMLKTYTFEQLDKCNCIMDLLKNVGNQSKYEKYLWNYLNQRLFKTEEARKYLNSIEDLKKFTSLTILEISIFVSYWGLKDYIKKDEYQVSKDYGCTSEKIYLINQKVQNCILKIISTEHEKQQVEELKNDYDKFLLILKSKNYEGILDLRYDVLDISTKAYNSLKRSGIKTIREIVNLDYNELYHIKGFGEKIVSEIIAVLKQYGLELSKDKSNSKTQMREKKKIEELQEIHKQKKQYEKILKNGNIESILDLRIEVLDFPSNVINRLKRNNVNTIKELTDLTYEELYNIRNIGTATVIIIVNKLESIGLHLKEKTLNLKF